MAVFVVVSDIVDTVTKVFHMVSVLTAIPIVQPAQSSYHTMNFRDHFSIQNALARYGRVIEYPESGYFVEFQYIKFVDVCV